jgi:heme-degrading monooxygenase HmoA
MENALRAKPLDVREQYERQSKNLQEAMLELRARKEREMSIIVRTWHGCVPLMHAEAFALHLDMTGVQHAHRTDGNLGVFVRRKTQAEMEHFFLATYWESWDAIKKFAGEQYEVAVTYPDDEKFSLISDPFVFHHEVSHITSLR